jgi:hypothetical protein
MTRSALRIVALGACAFQVGAQSVVVAGRVRADSARGPAIDGAEVSILPGLILTRTDSAGAFRASLPDTGLYLLTVRAIGYRPIETTIAVADKGGASIDVVMHRFVMELPAVEVKGARRDYISPSLRAFEDRRREGLGRFIPETTLRTMEHRQLADVLSSQVAGLQVIHRGSKSYAGSTRRNGCFATLYLDGVLIYRGKNSMGSPPDLADYQVSMLAGVEYYAGVATAPQGYPHDGCGLLLLWTRER